MALPENLHRTLMLYGSPEVAEQKRLALYQLIHAASIRKYILKIWLSFHVRNSPYDDLLEAFFRIEECRCCARHQRARPCSPHDGRYFQRQFPRQHHRCKCKCRFLLRMIADEVVAPSI
jgi:hypothetical protein